MLSALLDPPYRPPDSPPRRWAVRLVVIGLYMATAGLAGVVIGCIAGLLVDRRPHRGFEPE